MNKKPYHTPQCEAQTASILKAQIDFVARHPNYCKKCGGAGMFYTPATWEEPSDIEPCSECEGKCPLCGGSVSYNEDGQLSCDAQCGYNSDDIEVYPELDMCDCYEIEFKETLSSLSESERQELLRSDWRSQ